MPQVFPNTHWKDSGLIHVSTANETWRELFCQPCSLLLCTIYITTLDLSDLSCTKKNPLVRKRLYVSMVQFSSKNLNISHSVQQKIIWQILMEYTHVETRTDLENEIMSNHTHYVWHNQMGLIWLNIDVDNADICNWARHPKPPPQLMGRNKPFHSMMLHPKCLNWIAH